MMEFLRGLAPHHTADATSAVAALPSRFEVEQPLRIVPPRAQPVDFVDDREISEAPRVAAPVSSPGPGPWHAVASTREPAGVPPAADATAFSPRPSLVEPSRPSRSPEATPTVPSTWIGVIAARRADVAAPEYPLRLPQPQPAPAVRDIGSRPFPSHSEMHPEAVAPMARSRGAASAGEAPLSRRTVEAHAEQRVDRRPIVHVTIDRIDVSAPPSAPDRLKPPARSRRSSSQSLNDYLRARHPGQQGDAS